MTNLSAHRCAASANGPAWRACSRFPGSGTRDQAISVRRLSDSSIGASSASCCSAVSGTGSTLSPSGRTVGMGVGRSGDSWISPDLCWVSRRAWAQISSMSLVFGVRWVVCGDGVEQIGGSRTEVRRGVSGRTIGGEDSGAKKGEGERGGGGGLWMLAGAGWSGALRCR